jgi:hypothetical protein
VLGASLPCASAFDIATKSDGQGAMPFGNAGNAAAISLVISLEPGCWLLKVCGS